jgi:hypothetical protein
VPASDRERPGHYRVPGRVGTRLLLMRNSVSSASMRAELRATSSPIEAFYIADGPICRAHRRL